MVTFKAAIIFKAGIYIIGGKEAKIEEGYRKEQKVARATIIKHATANFSNAGAFALK